MINNILKESSMVYFTMDDVEYMALKNKIYKMPKNSGEEISNDYKSIINDYQLLERMEDELRTKMTSCLLQLDEVQKLRQQEFEIASTINKISEIENVINFSKKKIRDGQRY